MSSNKSFLDSSDSESENGRPRENNVSDIPSYVKYLSKIIKLPIQDDKDSASSQETAENEGYITDQKEFLKKLGQVLENYAPFVIKSPAVRENYKDLKSKYLGLNEDEYDQAVYNIKDFLNRNSEIFTKNIDITDISDKEAVQCFNHAFNPHVDLPTSISLKGPNSRHDLLSAMQNDTKFRTAGFLKVGVSLELEATEGATNFIAMARLLNRWHKNKMKDAQSIGDDGSGSSIIMTKTETSERSVSSGTTSATLNHKSSNIQTIVDELGTYDKISKEIYEDRRLTNSAIKIVQSVQKLSSKGLVQEGLTAKEEKYMMNLASLMLLTEVERNETSIFTTPMFLEKAQTSDSAIEDYPMALKGAVMASRAVGILFTDTILDRNKMDHVVLKGKKLEEKRDPADELLRLEGKLFAEWSENNAINCRLQTRINALASIKIINDQEDKSTETPLENDILIIRKYAESAKTPNDQALFIEAADSLAQLTNTSDSKKRPRAYQDEVIDKLKIVANEGLEQDLHVAFDAINTKILRDWYSIDTSRIFEKRADINLTHSDTADVRADHSHEITEKALPKSISSSIQQDRDEQHAHEGNASLENQNKSKIRNSSPIRDALEHNKVASSSYIPNSTAHDQNTKSPTSSPSHK